MAAKYSSRTDTLVGNLKTLPPCFYCISGDVRAVRPGPPRLSPPLARVPLRRPRGPGAAGQEVRQRAARVRGAPAAGPGEKKSRFARR